MKIKMTLAVLALTLAPSLALAQGCMTKTTQQSASQCAAGQVWNETTQSCAVPANS